MYELIYVIMLTIVTPTDVREKAIAFSLHEEACILLANGATLLKTEHQLDEETQLVYSCRPILKSTFLGAVND